MTVARVFPRRLVATIGVTMVGSAVLSAAASAALLPVLPVVSALLPLPGITVPVAAPAAPAPTQQGSTQAPVTTAPVASPAPAPAPAPASAPVPVDPLGALQQALLPTCGATVHPFAQFGDSNAYFAFPNNGFESGTVGWRLSGASVVKGNEPWQVNGPGSSSLSLSPSGTAASPLVCINLLDPDWRMFARAAGANGPLHAQVVFYGVTGNITGLVNFNDLPVAKYTSWAPTATIRSILALPLLTRYAQLRVSSAASRGSWQLDDVFVDPWANRG